jgi:hypothetical protein
MRMFFCVSGSFRAPQCRTNIVEMLTLSDFPSAGRMKLPPFSTGISLTLLKQLALQGPGNVVDILMVTTKIRSDSTGG